MNAELQTKLTIEDLARETIAECDGSISEMGLLLLEKIKAHIDLYNSFTEEAIIGYAISRVRLAITSQRASLLGQGKNAGDRPNLQVVVNNDDGFRETLIANSTRLMEQRLFGGKRLGDSTPQEVRESAENYQKQGRTLTLKARWQFAIAELAEKNGVGPTDPIKSSLSEATLAKLWEAADVD